MNEYVLRLPTSEFRTLPLPNGNDDAKPAKLATCFVRADDLPEELEDMGWLQVNPRVPKRDRKDRIKGSVAKAIIETLNGEADKFAIKNQGIYFLAKQVSFEKEQGGAGFVSITFNDPKAHGLVNGGHTYLAILQARQERPEGEPNDAYVRLHIYEGIDDGSILELAEGLNRSMQVDDPSLENLRGSFEQIKRTLEGETGADQIAFRQGDTGDIDIRQVLSYMALLDLTRYPDRKSHPNKIFGQQKAVLQYFLEDQNSKKPVFDILLPRCHEILTLADRIQQEGVKPEHKLGRLKVKGSKSGNRVASRRHKGRPAHFAGGTIDGWFPLGWLYPMLAAFRANVSPASWQAGKFEWLMDPSQLLDAVIGEMAEVVKQEHEDNKEKPAEVGRKTSAYRLCYGIVTMELASRGKLQDAA